MATFARSLSLPAGLRSVATRRLALALGSMTALAVSLLLAAAVLPAPAGAHVVELSGAKFGVTETPWLSPCAASVFHSYKYRGIYPVTLTVTDVGGNKESVTHSITVEGKSPPPPAAGAAGAAGSGQTTAITGPAASSAPATRSVASPVAAAAVVSRSLKTALRKGLAVRYSVNEQVTGRFEVLLDRTVARRLGITDPAAIGLPAGTSPSLVVARAILVTTKGGRSTVDIRFSPRTALVCGACTR